MHPSWSLFLRLLAAGYTRLALSFTEGEGRGTKIYLRPSLTGSALPSVLHFSSVLDGVKKALNYESVNGELRQSEIGFWNRLDNDILLGSTRWGLIDWRKWWTVERCNIFFQLFNQLIIIFFFFVLTRRIISFFLCVKLFLLFFVLIRKIISFFLYTIDKS